MAQSINEIFETKFNEIYEDLKKRLNNVNKSDIQALSDTIGNNPNIVMTLGQKFIVENLLLQI